MLLTSAGLFTSCCVSKDCKDAKAILEHPWLATESKEPAQTKEVLDNLPVSDMVREAREDDEVIRILSGLLNKPTL